MKATPTRQLQFLSQLSKAPIDVDLDDYEGIALAFALARKGMASLIPLYDAGIHTGFHVEGIAVPRS